MPIKRPGIGQLLPPRDPLRLTRFIIEPHNAVRSSENKTGICLGELLANVHVPEMICPYGVRPHWPANEMRQARDRRAIEPASSTGGRRPRTPLGALGRDLGLLTDSHRLILQGDTNKSDSYLGKTRRGLQA